MSAKLNNAVIDICPERIEGAVWYRLHEEREDICEALLREPSLARKILESQRTSNQDAVSTANWHREMLQARLRLVDGALDRLMSGSYGNCSKCGRWIEDTKLDFDPAIAYCVECWRRMQTQH